MKRPMQYFAALAILANLALAACGSDTVIHEKPVVVQTAPTGRTIAVTPDSVEATCKNGYDNHAHACY